MPDIPPDESRRASGKALSRSGLDIDRLSEVTEKDIARARRDWRSRVSDAFKRLIDAKPESEEAS
jgi:hypothetical protein